MDRKVGEKERIGVTTQSKVQTNGLSHFFESG